MSKDNKPNKKTDADKKTNDPENNNSNNENHVGKKVNSEKSKSKTDLDVKNEVTGANLDAPSG